MLEYFSHVAILSRFVPPRRSEDIPNSTQYIGTECTLTELVTTERSLQQLKPGVAPIAQQAPRVTSGTRKGEAAFAPLLKLGQRVTGNYTISRGKSSARLFWPGLCVSLQELVQLLKTLPRDSRIHGASRSGDTTRSFAFGDKLYMSKLTPPVEDGLLLYWKQPPAALADLESDRAESETSQAVGVSLGKESVREEGDVAKNFEHAQPLPEKKQVATEEISREGSQAAPKSHSPNEFAEKLTTLPRFQAAYQALNDDKPPLDTVRLLLEMLCQGSGQVTLKTLTEKLELSEDGLSTLLTQMDTMLHKPGEYLLFLSIDQKMLLLNLDGLSRSFSLELSEDDVKVVCAETIEGKKRAVRLPIELKAKERQALEALLRYGRLSEQELSRITGSRRVGGLLERLVAKLDNEGFFGLAVVGEGAEGRIFSLQED